ncbi:RagB/SusD family nutrient uptake outer membrane protein [Sphingobacterium faecium]|uniref:RagB/SusD family nutrient uptake outer membrane protein n=1 Tax=Sphingobacterium faecium TaxID=34087 RepID=UPI00246879B6|nr:RagB/SusD family nutrient uptake outer membrane protein [Sphingobacterium faecium]MDH5825824.1 RagB/SusD family nutrient uptake outer membrane protein [Sphingobacterium faecium]
MKINHLFYILIIVSGCFIQLNCTDKFLDQKPDMTMAVPKTLADCQAMLDDYARMNTGYPDHGEGASDNCFFSDLVCDNFIYFSETPEDKHNYLWNPVGEHVEQWQSSYKVIYSANMILEVLEKYSSSDRDYNSIKGSALFFRAFAYYNLAQLFCKPYTSKSANTDLGIPLRMTPNPQEMVTRGTVQQVYDRITQDLTEAIALLPKDTPVKSRPSKAAGYAALARTYLSMEAYEEAGKMADECLKLHNTLIDYNATSNPATATTVNVDDYTRFLRFNAEVIFQATSIYTQLSSDQAFVDPDLYNSYLSNDRRKVVFFTTSYDPYTGEPGNAFVGNYDGSVQYLDNPSLFVGFSTNELYLIRAECRARAGNTLLAMSDLNTLMAKRMEHPYVNRTAANAEDALKQILMERRKELLFRGIRWTDLRRLNKDPRFAVTLRRNMNSLPYTPLQPNDLRYVMLIPTKQEINLTGMTQNPR